MILPWIRTVPFLCTLVTEFGAAERFLGHVLDAGSRAFAPFMIQPRNRDRVLATGFLQGLAVLPIVLSLCGPKPLQSAVPSSRSLLLDSWEEEDGTVLYLGSSPPGSPRARNDRRGRPESYGGMAGRVPGGALGWHWGSSEQLYWGSGDLQEGRRHVQGVWGSSAGERSSAGPGKGGNEDAPL